MDYLKMKCQACSDKRDDIKTQRKFLVVFMDGLYVLY